MKKLIIAAIIYSIGAQALAEDIEPDLKTFPIAKPYETRWVIKLPRLENESIHKVELTFIGSVVKPDCNRWGLTGDLKNITVEEWQPYYKFIGGWAVPLTRKLCSPNDLRITNFHSPVVITTRTIPYNSSLPLVIYTKNFLRVEHRVVQIQIDQK